MSELGNVDEISEGFLWRIGDICTLIKDHVYCSPKFSFADNNWHLFVVRGNKSRCINVELRRISMGSPLIVDYTISFKTLDGKKDKEHCRCDVKEVSLKPGLYRILSIQESFVIEREPVSSNVFAVLCVLKLPTSVHDKSKCRTLKLV